jgi:hypothetical protein
MTISSYFNFLGEQIFLVAARKVISNGGDLDRKGNKCRDSKETFRNRLSRIRLCLTRLAYQVLWAGDSRNGVRWLIYARQVSSGQWAVGSGPPSFIGSRLMMSDLNNPGHLEIFLPFTRATGHLHPHFMTAINNYFDLLLKMNESEVQDREKSVNLVESYGISLG